MAEPSAAYERNGSKTIHRRQDGITVNRNVTDPKGLRA
jgi:hypothetical protein